jgi:hypothetical protein
MAEPLKCPQCGAPLEKGYIQAPRGLSWDNTKHRWETLTVEELIDDLSFTIPNREAYRCQQCRLVVVKY